MNKSTIDAISNVVGTYTKPSNIADIMKDISQQDQLSAIIGVSGLVDGILSAASKSNPGVSVSIGVGALANDLSKVVNSSTEHGTIQKADVLSIASDITGILGGGTLAIAAMTTGGTVGAVPILST